jgi:hypothetical protein
MNMNEKDIWFPAKKYGLGWGLPCAWQGWVALGLFVALNCATPILFLTQERHFGFYIASTAVLAVALLITCYVKGEKPRWRWGKD